VISCNSLLSGQQGQVDSIIQQRRHLVEIEVEPFGIILYGSCGTNAKPTIPNLTWIESRAGLPMTKNLSTWTSIAWRSLLVCIPNRKSEIATPPFRISKLVAAKHRGFAMTKYPSPRGAKQCGDPPVSLSSRGSLWPWRSLLVCIPNSKSEIATPPYHISKLVAAKHRGFAMTKDASTRAQVTVPCDCDLLFRRERGSPHINLIILNTDWQWEHNAW